jgi:putative ABC transport system ATP-binding protein
MKKQASKRKKIIEVINLTKTFTDGDKDTTVLKGLDFAIEEGEFVAIMGRSGAGKSTLMYQLSLLDTPTTGSLLVDGVNILALSQEAKTDFRLRKLGYVFQDYSLILELTAIENVMIPLLMQGDSEEKAFAKAKLSLDSVGLAEKIHNLPSKLSGGEQQRVSIARAITHSPTILFADEPTANLDSLSSETVISIFEQLNKEKNLTVVMVTHEEDFGKRADRIIKLSDGLIVGK